MSLPDLPTAHWALFAAFQTASSNSDIFIQMHHSSGGPMGPGIFFRRPKARKRRAAPCGSRMFRRRRTKYKAARNIRDPPPRWCPGRDSNPQAFRHTHLKRTRLPVPPRPQINLEFRGKLNYTNIDASLSIACILRRQHKDGWFFWIIRLFKARSWSTGS